MIDLEQLRNELRAEFNRAVDSWEDVDPRVKEVMKAVDREPFLPHWVTMPNRMYLAYQHQVVEVSKYSSVSQPYTVARMTTLLEPQRGDFVFESGAGSAYQAVILSHLVGNDGYIITTDINQSLVRHAQKRVESLGYNNIQIQTGDGLLGSPSEGPFERIISTAAVRKFPQTWKDQLTANGTIVTPRGFDPMHARLVRVRKFADDTFAHEEHDAVRFHPSLGEAEGGFSREYLDDLLKRKERYLEQLAEAQGQSPLKYMFGLALQRGLTRKELIRSYPIPEHYDPEQNPFTLGEY